MANEFVPHDDTLDPDGREIAELRAAQRKEPNLTDLWRDAIAEDLEEDDEEFLHRRLTSAEESRLMSEGYCSDLGDDIPARRFKMPGKKPKF
jgi:hypothetical protein